MRRSVKEIGVVLCLIAMASFLSWPIWKWLYVREVNAALYARTKALVDKNPQLQPAWAIALQDDVLTKAEAQVIVEAAGEKVTPEE